MKETPITRKEAAVLDRMEKGEFNNKQQLDQHDSYERRRQATRDREAEKTKAANKSAQNTVKALINIGQNAAKLYYYWNYMANPVTLEIAAFGCAGTKNATLKCFPDGKFEFDLFSDKIAENVKKIRYIGDLLQKIAAIFHKRGHWEFLKGPQLLLTTAYKELTKDKPDKGLVKSQVNRYYEISFGFEQLVLFQIEFTLPLLNFFGPMGAAANFFLNLFGIEGDGYILFSFAVNPKIAAKWTEYNEWSFTLFNFKMKLQVEIGARARFRDIAEIYAAGYVEVSIEFTEPSLGGQTLCKIKAKGSLQIGCKAGGVASWWGFRKSFQIDYKPPDWRYSLGDGELYISKLS
jgi:hypothetical protein